MPLLPERENARRRVRANKNQSMTGSLKSWRAVMPSLRRRSLPRFFVVKAKLGRERTGQGCASSLLTIRRGS